MTENPNESKAVTKGTLAAGFSVASVWFGTHVGAGFATGNQILNYYVQYGWTAVLFRSYPWACWPTSFTL